MEDVSEETVFTDDEMPPLEDGDEGDGATSLLSSSSEEDGNIGEKYSSQAPKGDIVIRVVFPADPDQDGKEELGDQRPTVVDDANFTEDDEMPPLEDGDAGDEGDGATSLLSSSSEKDGNIGENYSSQAPKGDIVIRVVFPARPDPDQDGKEELGDQRPTVVDDADFKEEDTNPSSCWGRFAEKKPVQVIFDTAGVATDYFNWSGLPVLLWLFAQGIQKIAKKDWLNALVNILSAIFGLAGALFFFLSAKYPWLASILSAVFDTTMGTATFALVYFSQLFVVISRMGEASNRVFVEYVVAPTSVITIAHFLAEILLSEQNTRTKNFFERHPILKKICNLIFQILIAAGDGFTLQAFLTLLYNPDSDLLQLIISTACVVIGMLPTLAGAFVNETNKERIRFVMDGLSALTYLIFNVQIMQMLGTQFWRLVSGVPQLVSLLSIPAVTLAMHPPECCNKKGCPSFFGWLASAIKGKKTIEVDHETPLLDSKPNSYGTDGKHGFTGDPEMPPLEKDDDDQNAANDSITPINDDGEAKLQRKSYCTIL